MKFSQYRSKKTYQLLKILYVIFVTFALLTVATYTWFDLSFVPSVNDMAIYINSGNGLTLSFENTDEEDSWSPQLDLREKLPKETKPLIPVTYSKSDNRFYTAGYGADGRIIGLNQPVPEKAKDESVINNGYYMQVTFYARSDQDCSVYLAEAVETEQGKIGAGTWLVGTPVWDAVNVRHTNGGKGAETAMRVGIKVTEMSLTGTEIGTGTFYVYEPNYDTHIGGGTGYQITPSINGGSLADTNRHILQSTSSWTDADLVQKNVVISQLGQFKEEPFLFDLIAGKTVKIDLYFWLEGQDIDCGNLLVDEAMILANVQFRARIDGGSDLKPIM